VTVTDGGGHGSDGDDAVANVERTSFQICRVLRATLERDSSGTCSWYWAEQNDEDNASHSDDNFHDDNDNDGR